MGDRATIRRHPERAVPDDAPAVLAEGRVAHVGIVQDGEPVVIPLLYGWSPDRPDRIVLHGSKASRMQRALRGGVPVCITVTLLDGLVFSRSAKYHSANYRSVVCFGRAQEITEPEAKAAAMEAMTSRYFQGRSVGRDYAPASERDLEEITVVEVHVEEWSAKARRGEPRGPLDEQADAPGTRGVVGV